MDSIQLLDNYYEETFDEISYISSGEFGLVFNAKHKDSSETFAVKKIPFQKDKENIVLKEAIMIQSLDQDYVVKCYKIWIEKNNTINFNEYKNYDIKSISSHRIVNPKFEFLLHIQMEMCCKNLSELMNNELKFFSIQNFSFKTVYVLYEIFREIVESINYLHSHNPPIIHRDLKPSNILVTNGSTGRFIKLADFGLSVFHERESQSHTTGVGTKRYMAPELIGPKDKHKYGVEVDIYSLGMILKEIFNYDLNKAAYETDDIIKKNLFVKIGEIILKMINNVPKLRPTCDEILTMKLWDNAFIKYLHNNMNKTHQNDNFDFINLIFQTKLSLRPTKIVEENDRKNQSLSKFDTDLYNSNSCVANVQPLKQKHSSITFTNGSVDNITSNILADGDEDEDVKEQLHKNSKNIICTDLEIILKSKSKSRDVKAKHSLEDSDLQNNFNIKMHLINSLDEEISLQLQRLTLEQLVSEQFKVAFEKNQSNFFLIMNDIWSNIYSNLNLKNTHNDIKQKILNDFKEDSFAIKEKYLDQFKDGSNDIKLDDIFQKMQIEFYKKLSDSMDEDFKSNNFILKASLSSAYKQYLDAMKMR